MEGCLPTLTPHPSTLSLMLKPRIGMFFIYWGVVILLIFVAKMQSGQTDAAAFFFGGIGLALIGLLIRRGAKRAALAAPPSAPAPAPAPRPAPAGGGRPAAKKPLLRLPSFGKKPPPRSAPPPAPPPPKPRGLKALFKPPTKKK